MLLPVLAAAKQASLVVCVRSASNLPDLDYGEKKTTDGSDPFVAVFVGSTLMFKTEYRANTANPVWNHCHLLDSGSYNTSSSISFVILDADLKTIDDIIGVGCTTAATGSREIDLEGPAAADESNRGRLKVEIFLFDKHAVEAKDGAAVSPTTPAWQWQTVTSEGLHPQMGQPGVEVSVRCPSGMGMSSCLCSSASGEPGCASSVISLDDHGMEVCTATSNRFVSSPPLPACAQGSGFGATYRRPKRDDDEIPGITCAPLGWTPPGPSPVHAVARCTSGGSLGRATSPESRTAPMSDTEVECALPAPGSGPALLTGCSPASSYGLGARFEDDDRNGLKTCQPHIPDPNPDAALARAQSNT